VRYRIRQKLFSIGEDYWVTDDRGARVYKVDGKLIRLRKSLVLEDADGHGVLTVHEPMLSWRDTMDIDSPQGMRIATVKKATLAPLRARWTVDTAGGELYVTGDVAGHEYRIERGGQTLAAVSAKWFEPSDDYGVEVYPGAETTVMLAIAAVLDATAHGPS
jgi:uncharacterized protein YxjI